ncbi:Asp-tRNA(Asn)/Glu-tRNA(Gln) amidotransferase subunit GatC [Peptoniphilus equinus]|uniref:Asp-tRNA(Asn)/Glu-tRNA(Gln) amidotransferase subunit GatC n=1 Tax=Peptoniphilus equinus TaxID=3016343 RepID=A0ABY7QUY9_9FIRM|nr:Asp-tRNA(Asn)/Glu-tRNA(Gln) amidotransferase subunit GatC [Peptoniphilus equinus]WBW50614.1 Asp-tRNA(Asn)/Glu-tRNA(Gln) amidotransferase subunit GatC [Peptoniphilus equinus]
MTLDEIKHIADIAMIDFTDEELQAFEKNFNETFELIESIDVLDLDNVDLTFQVNATINHLRPDVAHESFSAQEATANASEEKYGYFKTIKFVD